MQLRHLVILRAGLGAPQDPPGVRKKLMGKEKGIWAVLPTLCCKSRDAQINRKDEKIIAIATAFSCLSLSILGLNY